MPASLAVSDRYILPACLSIAWRIALCFLEASDEFGGVADQFVDAVNIQLLHDVGAVIFYSFDKVFQALSDQRVIVNNQYGFLGGHDVIP